MLPYSNTTKVTYIVIAVIMLVSLTVFTTLVILWTDEVKYTPVELPVIDYQTPVVVCDSLLCYKGVIVYAYSLLTSNNSLNCTVTTQLSESQNAIVTYLRQSYPIGSYDQLYAYYNGVQVSCRARTNAEAYEAVWIISLIAFVVVTSACVITCCFCPRC